MYQRSGLYYYVHSAFSGRNHYHDHAFVRASLVRFAFAPVVHQPAYLPGLGPVDREVTEACLYSSLGSRPRPSRGRAT